jgi:hypothetical protein
MQSGTTGSLGGSSFGVQTAQLSFDVKKESDVIALLKYIHQNPIDPEVKNSIRDAVFAYRQDQNATSLEVLKKICSLVGILVAGAEVSGTVVQKAESTTTRFNTGRPLPSFGAVSVKSESTVTVEPEKKEIKASNVNSVPFRKIVVPTFDAPTVVVPEPPKSVEPVVTAHATPVAPVVEVVPAIDLSVAQARISEIKHAVNAKVGNPVNLIDSHNEIGRTYMNALLDAMKKANGGVPGELSSAMVALEAAYTQVLQALEGTTATTAVPKEEVTAPVAPQMQTAVTAAAPVEVAPVSTPTQTNPAVFDEARKQAIEARLTELKSRVEQAKKVSAPVAQVVPPEPAPLEAPSYTATNESTTTPEPSPIVRRQEVTAPQDSGMHSVAKNKQLQDLLRSNREKELTAVESKQKDEIAKMDPIMTPEVTAGLSQLLSEWSLFRSSGFFGTGPSGKDHALYQKLAGLTMASVIAGRFEGATPLIKQSIGDYMNGWRYEEGIVHEHGETFEHYLRKVVYHIIEKKKKAILTK